MYGAILGDIIGSPHGFDRGNKTKDFELFSGEARFTGTAVLTVAVAEGILFAGRNATDDEIRERVQSSMIRWGKSYPGVGYGDMFSKWLEGEEPKPYGSFGSGSAARGSAAGWLYDTIERTRQAAAAQAEVTHNHTEGIRGAEAVASVIFLARNGGSKDEIRQYVTGEFGYDLSRTCDEIRPGYHHAESCQETVPEAVTAFLEGENFEDVVRTAVSLGGDCGATAAIAGSMAEAFYGIPENLIEECRKRIPKEMADASEGFYYIVKRVSADSSSDPLAGNIHVEDAIMKFHQDTNQENFVSVLLSLRTRLRKNGNLLVAVEIPEDIASMIDREGLKPGDTLKIGENIQFQIIRVKDDEGKVWIPAFTSVRERDVSGNISAVSRPMGDFFRQVLSLADVEGVILNPWSNPMRLSKEVLEALFSGGDKS